MQEINALCIHEPAAAIFTFEELFHPEIARILKARFAAMKWVEGDPVRERPFKLLSIALLPITVINTHVDWLTFAHDSQRSAWAFEESVLPASTAQNLELKSSLLLIFEMSGKGRE